MCYLVYVDDSTVNIKKKFSIRAHLKIQGNSAYASAAG